MADNGQIANTAGLQVDTGQGGNFSRGSCRGGIHLGGNRGGGPNRDMSNGSYTRQGAVGYWSGWDNHRSKINDPISITITIFLYLID